MSSTYSSTAARRSSRTTWASAGLKEIRLLLDWKLPLNFVYVGNEREQMVIYRTIYVSDAHTGTWATGRGEDRELRDA